MHKPFRGRSVRRRQEPYPCVSRTGNDFRTKYAMKKGHACRLRRNGHSASRHQPCGLTGAVSSWQKGKCWPGFLARPGCSTAQVRQGKAPTGKYLAYQTRPVGNCIRLVFHAYINNVKCLRFSRKTIASRKCFQHTGTLAGLVGRNHEALSTCFDRRAGCVLKMKAPDSCAGISRAEPPG